MDALKNFAYSLVAVAPVPATSGTAITVTTGQGSYFPSAPFDATIWPAGVLPSNTNAEIVRVTNVSTDTLTITRAQYGTTAQSIAVGYQIAQTVDANLLGQLAALSGATFTGAVSGTTATWTGEDKASDFAPTGLTGATTATRYVGGTANGAPASGTFAVGDFIVDQTGTIWVCTTAGTPGTWTTTISSHLSLRTASATVGRNEITIFSGSTASQTLTAPSSPIDGSTWTVINKASVAVTLSFTPSMIPLSSGTGVTTFSVPAGGAYSFINYNGSQWYMVSTNSADQLINVLPTANGGTGLSTLGTAGQVLTVNPGATGLTYTSVAGSQGSQLTAMNGTLPPAFWSPSTTLTSLAGPTYMSASIDTIMAGSAGVVAGGGSASSNIVPKGTVRTTAVYLVAGTVISKLWLPVTTAGSSATCYMGLYNATTQLAVTSSFTANATGWSVGTLTSSYTIPTTGIYYVAILVIGTSTTSPSVLYVYAFSGAFGAGSKFQPAPTTGNLAGQSPTFGSSLNTLPSTVSGTVALDTAAYLVGLS
jgi:hypothetical protein